MTVPVFHPHAAGRCSNGLPCMNHCGNGPCKRHCITCQQLATGSLAYGAFQGAEAYHRMKASRCHAADSCMLDLGCPFVADCLEVEVRP